MQLGIKQGSLVLKALKPCLHANRASNINAAECKGKGKVVCALFLN
jgi:hypothetical protein